MRALTFFFHFAGKENKLKDYFCKFDDEWDVQEQDIKRARRGWYEMEEVMKMLFMNVHFVRSHVNEGYLLISVFLGGR